MKHIRLVIPSLEPGGAEAVTVELANGFAQRGYNVHLVLFQAKGEFLSRLAKEVLVFDLRAGYTYYYAIGRNITPFLVL